MTELEKVFNEIQKEYNFAINKFPKFNSEHEGYAIIKEELDELWDEVKKNQSIRSNRKLYKEALQTATMSIRFIIDLLNKEII